MLLILCIDGKRVEVGAGRHATVGRGVGADLVVDDERVSREHLRVEWSDGGWTLRDNRSFNGTYDSFGRTIDRLRITEGAVVFLADKAGVRLDLELLDAPDGSTMVFSRDHKVLDDPVPAVISHGAGPIMVVGRDRDCDVVIEDLTVSRRHAEIRMTDSGAEVCDLKSANGVYVNGRRVRKERVPDGGVITIGRANLVVRGSSVEEFRGGFESELVVDRLCVDDRHGRPIVSDISFEVPQRSLVAILGPSGAGKSTVVKAMVGAVPAANGQVMYSGHDLLAGPIAVRRRIGYVPQDDILHGGLTVDRSLEYAARLRLADDATPSEIQTCITRVTTMLGLQEHRSKRVDQLSGGQRKRASTAMELLAEPPLLILDEPSSGLDPGNEKALMRLLADLAHDPDVAAASARRILVVTHSVQSLDLCDLVLVLAPGRSGEGGRVAYYGPPEGMTSAFGVEDPADVYRLLEAAESAPISADAGFVRHRSARRFGRGQHFERPPLAPREQFALLTRRYLDVLRSDRANLRLLVAQVPIVGLMLALITGDAFVRDGDRPPTGLLVLLLGLVLSMTYLAASNAIREVVKERPILERETMLGLDPRAYIASKVVVLGVVTVVQATVLVVIATARAGSLGIDPLVAVFISSRLELVLVVALTGLSALALALLVSTLVRNADRAMSVLPVVLLAMYLLSGGPTDLEDTPVLQQVSWVNSARWGFNGAAKATAASDLLGCDHTTESGVSNVGRLGDCRDSWDRSTPGFLGDLVALGLLTAFAIGAAVFAVRRA